MCNTHSNKYRLLQRCFLKIAGSFGVAQKSMVKKGYLIVLMYQFISVYNSRDIRDDLCLKNMYSMCVLRAFFFFLEAVFGIF